VQAKFPIPVTTLGDGMDVWVKVAAANTGATTFTPNPGVITAAPVIGAAHAALQGGELIAGGRANLIYRADVTSWVLTECTGAAIQVAPATQSQHAMQFGQVAGVVGSVRNLVMSITAASASATLTADEIVVETALGGLRYCLPSLSKTINLATTGAGGMDTGTAPASGYVAIYAIWNPTTSTAALLATNATSAAPPSVYGGANMPSGYTASALVGIWRTNGSSQLVNGILINREASFPVVTLLSLGTATSATSFSLSAAVPLGAKFWKGNGTAIASVASNGAFVGADANMTGLQTIVNPTTGTQVSSPIRAPIITPQTAYYYNTQSGGTNQTTVTCSGYEF
jgi:hypothetical protein